MSARRFGDPNRDWRHMMDPNSEEYDPGFFEVKKESDRVDALKQQIYSFAYLLSSSERDMYGDVAREPGDVAELFEDFEKDIFEVTESEEERNALTEALKYAKKKQTENAKQYLLESVQRYGSALFRGNHEYAEDITEDLQVRTFRFLEHTDIGVSTEDIAKTKAALERYKREPKLFYVDEIVLRLQKDIDAITNFFASRAKNRTNGVRSFSGSTEYAIRVNEDEYSWWTRTVDEGSLTATVRELQELVPTITDEIAYAEAQEMLEYYYQKIIDIPAIQAYYNLLGTYIQDIEEQRMDDEQKREVYDQLVQHIASIKDPSFATEMSYELYMASVIFGVPRPKETIQSDYSLLGVDMDADSQTIKKAYRALAKEHHPDRYTHAPESVQKFHEEKFKEVATAYERLLQRD